MTQGEDRVRDEYSGQRAVCARGENIEKYDVGSRGLCVCADSNSGAALDRKCKECMLGREIGGKSGTCAQRGEQRGV